MSDTPNNLNTFKILYLVNGILSLLGAIFLTFYFLFFLQVFSEINAVNPNEQMPFDPTTFFSVFIIIGLCFSIAFSVLSFLTSKFIKEEKNYNFIFVVAILNCLTGILGILLGVFTLIELNKPHVKEVFGKS